MCFSLDPSELDLDGEGGCKFLRVMLSLIMHDYPQLVYGALELLFRHFSQRQEVLQAFKQVSIGFSYSHCLCQIVLRVELLLFIAFLFGERSSCGLLVKMIYSFPDHTASLTLYESLLVTQTASGQNCFHVLPQT